MSLRKLLLLPAALAALAAPAAALATAPDHRGEVHKVCVTSTWIEHAPADHPIAPAYEGDHFRVTRSAYATARHTKWAKGVLTSYDKKSKRTFVHKGWIRVDAFGRC